MSAWLKKALDFIAGYNIVIHLVGILLCVECGVYVIITLSAKEKPDAGLIGALGGMGIAALGVGQWESQ